MSQSNDLFYKPDEYLNFALHKLEIDVMEIIEPEKKSDQYIYALVKEIHRDNLKKLEEYGFKFFCIEPYYNYKTNNDWLWIQFEIRTDIK